MYYGQMKYWCKVIRNNCYFMFNYNGYQKKDKFVDIIITQNNFLQFPIKIKI